MGAWHGDTAANHTDLLYLTCRRGRKNYIRCPDVVERIGSYLPPKFPLFHGWDQQWLNYYWLMLGESGWIFGLKTNMKYSKANIKIIKIVTSRLVLVQSIRAYFDQKNFFLPFFIGTLYFCTLPRSWSLHIFDTIAVFGQKMTFKKKKSFFKFYLSIANKDI